jgi:hypothetical protein
LKARSPLWLWCCCACLAGAACESNPPESAIAQFDRPQDVALVCLNRVESGGEIVPELLPLGCCAKASGSPGVEGWCSGPVAGAVLLAFVTQTTSGEVAVVDLDTLKIIDQDERIPYNSFVPVGGQPGDIAAAWDGSRVYTANLETEDLSVIDVAACFGPTFEPSASIPLHAPAARLVLGRAPEIRDRYAFVTLPTAGQLAVVALDPADCPAAGDQPGAGCLLGTLRLDAATGLHHAVPDDSPQGIAPFAIVASDRTPSLYVGGFAGHYLLEIDSAVLVQRALALDEPGPIDDGALVRRIELEEFTTWSLALEPRLERWLYAVENEHGGVLVIDLAAGETLPINAGNPLADHAYSIDVPGRARTVSLLSVSEEDDPGPLTFSGTFGVVSTTMAAIYVIDADDANADPPLPHTLRAGVDYYDEEAAVSPGLVKDPVLLADGTQLSPAMAEKHAFFAEPDPDAGLPDCGEAGAEFQPAAEGGIRFACDVRRSTNERWSLTWEGALGISGAGVIQFEVSDLPAGYLVLADESKNFCSRGLLGRDQGATYDGIPELQGYDGDLLVVTSDPAPLGGADCSQFEDVDLVFQVAEVLAPDTLRLVRWKSSTPWPDQACFGQALTYEIRAQGHWVLEGTASGHLTHGSADAQGQCVPYSQDPGQEETLRFRRQRVFDGRDFYNAFFSFRIEEGELGKVGLESLEFQWETTGGFAPLGSVLGSDMTDIEPTPDWNLVLIDRGGQGLILFDLLDSFQALGSPVK